MSLRPIWPALALVLLSACDGRDDTPVSTVPNAEHPSHAAPVPVMDTLVPPTSSPAAIRLAEDYGANGTTDSKRLSSDTNRLSLHQILVIASAAVPGEVIAVELDEDEDDGPEYEIEILTPQGRIIEIKIAAHTGKILKIEND